MPTRRLRPSPSSTGLTIPADLMQLLRWSSRTPLDVQCQVAWTDTPDGHVARCLTFTITAAVPSGSRRPLRKVA